MKIPVEKLKQIYKYLNKNKYWITIVIFAVIILFFHQRNIFTLINNNQKLRELKKQEQYLDAKIKQDSLKLKQLKENNKTLEKFAREQYFFHKPNEEVFVIERVKK